MPGEEIRTQIVFLDLDPRLLWQLTRALAPYEDRITVDCVKEPSAAAEICERHPVRAIVVDGWDKAKQAAYHLGGEQGFDKGPWTWIVLVESLPIEALPGGRISASVVFLERPFNPKEFPRFLMRVLEGPMEPPPAEEPVERAVEEVSLPVTPGESYTPPEGAPAARGQVDDEGPGKKPETVEPMGAEDEAAAFYDYLDRGFACLKEKDWQRARDSWWKALQIRPDDKRLRANLVRLERMLADRRGTKE